MAVKIDVWRIVSRRPLIAGLVVAGLLAACSGGGSDDDAAPVTNPVTTPVTTPVTSLPTTAGTAAESQAGERVAVDGVTFVVPHALAADVVPRLDTSNTDEATVRVLLFDDDAVEVGMVRVATVRDERGVLAARSPDDEEVLRAIDEGTAKGDALPFVNGAGVRDATDRYRFVGVTTRGSQLVEVTAASEVGADSMDALTESLFVDEQADVFAVSTCEIDVETISDVAIEDGAVVSPGGIVTATWQARNSGTCAWTDRDGWVFSGGDSVTVVQISEVGLVEPGGEEEVSVTFRAPSEAGIYVTQWQFLAAGTLELVDTPIPVTFEVVAD